MLLDIGMILVGILYIFKKPRTLIINFFKKNGLWIVFVLALLSTLGSLFFSEIAMYEPCKLCWFQRIFMYPLVIISGIALWKKINNIVFITIPMALIGLIISGYHYVIQFLPLVITCSIDGTDCTTMPFLTFGYVTIPMMAFTAFLAIIISSCLYAKK